MTPGRLADLVLTVRKSEAAAQWPDHEGVPSGWWPEQPATETGRWAVLELHLREFGHSQIDAIFGFPRGTARSVVTSGKLHPRARQIVAAHFDGKSPSRISRDVGVNISTICELLDKIGEEPHRVRDLAKSSDLNRAVIRLYEELRGKNAERIYQQIADRLGISVTDVRNRVAYARRKGRISLPPKRTGRRAAE